MGSFAAARISKAEMLLVQSHPAGLVKGHSVPVFGADDVEQPLRSVFDAMFP